MKLNVESRSNNVTGRSWDVTFSDLHAEVIDGAGNKVIVATLAGKLTSGGAATLTLRRALLSGLLVTSLGTRPLAVEVTRAAASQGYRLRVKQSALQPQDIAHAVLGMNSSVALLLGSL